MARYEERRRLRLSRAYELGSGAAEMDSIASRATTDNTLLLYNTQMTLTQTLAMQYYGLVECVVSAAMTRHR